MKIRQLLYGISMMVFVVSCTKQDTPLPKETVQEFVTAPTQSVSTTETNNKAYIFIEPQAKCGVVTKYMKDTAKAVNFYSFWVGLNLNQSNVTDINKYIDLPYWYNGVLPSVKETEVPQVSGGVDLNNKPVVAYNFKSFVIPKNTINDYVWVTILIPTSSMSNDLKRQKVVEYSYKTNGVTKYTQNLTLTGSAPYSLLVNYTGNKIPQGTYRVVSTWTNTGMRVKLNTTDDVYFRGNGN
jgi:hypothetical protein